MLTATVLPNGNLKITLDPESRTTLEKMRDEDPDRFTSDDAMYDIFEHFVCNSEYCWINPEDTGDLTSAPILGILGPAESVEKRWGFMNYAITSPQEQLLQSGFCIFQAPT